MSELEIIKMLENKVDLSTAGFVPEYIDLINKIKVKILKEQNKFNKNTIFGEGAAAGATWDFQNNIFKHWKKHSHKHPSKYTSLGGALVDMYTLLRMFKNFDIKGKERGPNKCRNISEQNSILVFAGRTHINCYKRILIVLCPLIRINIPVIIISMIKQSMFQALIYRILHKFCHLRDMRDPSSEIIMSL